MSSFTERLHDSVRVHITNRSLDEFRNAAPSDKISMIPIQMPYPSKDAFRQERLISLLTREIIKQRFGEKASMEHSLSALDKTAREYSEKFGEPFPALSDVETAHPEIEKFSGLLAQAKNESELLSIAEQQGVHLDDPLRKKMEKNANEMTEKFFEILNKQREG